MQHSPIRRPNGTRPVTIEVAGEPLGVVLPESEGYRFLAVRLPVFAIDGRLYDTVEAAQQAASALVSGR